MSAEPYDQHARRERRGTSARPAWTKLMVVILGAAVMALSGGGLAGYLDLSASAAPAPAPPADAPPLG